MSAKTGRAPTRRMALAVDENVKEGQMTSWPAPTPNASNASSMAWLQEVVIVTPSSISEAEPFLAKLRTTFLPNRVLTVAAQGRDIEAQARLVPLLQGKIARQGQATAYVCEKGVCRLPTTDAAVFARQLRKAPPPEAGR